MAQESGILKKNADKLLQDAVKALGEAQSEDIATKKQKQDLERKMA